jgi:ATP-dependent helicase/nuclease subunit A
MTRASERLVFSATEGSTSAASSWWQRVTQSMTPEATRLGGQPAVAAGSQPAGNALAMLPALHALSTAVRGASAADDDHAVDAARSRLGQAVHRVLEWAGRPQAPVLASHWPGLAAAASKEFRLDASLTEQVLALAKDVLESPDCAAFFGGPSLLWVGTEIALAAPSGVWRVDRVVKREHKGQMQWWVLDYKLHAAPEQVQAYRRQLQQYQQALQQLVPGETVHAAFIASGGRVVEL